MIIRKHISMLLVVLVIGAGLFVDAYGQVSREDTMPEVFKGVGITEQLGEEIPTNLTFVDETGQEVSLAGYFESEKPVILNFVYHDCPMLCSILLESFTKSMRDMEFVAGEEFDVLTVSFSATETADLAERQKSRYMDILEKPEAADGWHFLTGTEENIFALAEATGFGFKWVEETSEYAHPAALIFLDQSGTITRYIHGMNYPPADVRKAVVEASEGTVGSTIDRIFMYCYRYDARANAYVLQATQLMKLGGLLTLLVVCVGLLVFWRRERGSLEEKMSSTRESGSLRINRSQPI